MLTKTDMKGLEALLNARVRLITIDSLDEARVVETFVALGHRTQRPVFTWSVTSGLHRRDGGGPHRRRRRVIEVGDGGRLHPRKATGGLGPLP